MNAIELLKRLVNPMRKILLMLLMLVCLALCPAALADTISFDDFSAECEIDGGTYTILTRDNLAARSAWLDQHDLTVDAVLADFEARGVRFVTGEGYLAEIRADVIFRSPGIRPDIPEISAAIEKGADLTSEMALFCDFTKANIIAITGSDGKTTTTTLTHKFIDAELKRRGVGRAYVGGNIGAPLLPLVFEMNENDVAVVELSSFRLQTM